MLFNSPNSDSRGNDAPLYVNPNDIIIADEDGVVCVPLALVGEVVEACWRRKEQDDRVLEAVEGGMGMGKAMGGFR